MLQSVPLAAQWFRRLWLVHLVGEAANVLLPLGSVGGEPVKALLLKRRYDVPYRETAASLVLVQTVNTLTEVPFVLIGLVAMLDRQILSPIVEKAMIASVLVLVTFVVVLFAALHMRWLVSLQKRLEVGRWGARLSRGLAVLGDIEQRLYTFVRHKPATFTAAVCLAFTNWVFGALELFIVLRFLGAPVGFMDAWLMETCVVLVRNATFFIPGHLGTQDGIIALVGGALTGSPEIGLAAALVRRGRELVWSGAGLALGGWLGVKTAASELRH
jgi:uncharacterized protein (TIRG00374 family)